jgi:hypothetical protein
MENDVINQRPIRKEEAAVMVGRSVRSLERDMKLRRIAYYKSGKLVTFTLADIEEYRKRCLIKAGGN